MATWHPGLNDYVEWAQETSFLSSFKNTPDKYAIAIRLGLSQQTAILSQDINNVVATNSQIKESIDSNFDALIKINQTGFSNVISSIEQMHSNIDYHFGTLIQQIELQNELLSDVISVLQMPFEAKVRELYNKGCGFIEQGILDDAIQYFQDSISLRTGRGFFPSYYQLGRLYLFGKNEQHNFVDPEKATKALVLAKKYADGIYRVNPSFKPILADCTLLLSQSYYLQLRSKKKPEQDELLSNAIELGKAAIELNPQLSVGFYHLAKYYAYQGNVEQLLSNLQNAIEIDRNYALKVYDDGVFFRYKKKIDDFLEEMTDSKMKVIKPKLDLVNSYIKELENKNISNSRHLYNEFKNLKSIVQAANNDFETATYFGITDCERKLELL